MLSQKVYVNSKEVPGATAELDVWQFHRQTSVVKGETRLVSGAMSNAASLKVDRPISDDPLFTSLAKHRKSSIHVLVQVYAGDELIREFTFVNAVVIAYTSLGFNEKESIYFESLSDPTVTCGAPSLAG